MEYTVKVRFFKPPIRLVGFKDTGRYSGVHAVYDPVPELVGRIGYMNGTDEPYDHVMENPYSFLTKFGMVWADKEKDDFKIISFEEGNKIPKKFIQAKRVMERMARHEYVDAIDLRREEKKIGRKVLVAEAQNDREDLYEGKVGTIIGIDKIENVGGSVIVYYLIRMGDRFASIIDNRRGNLLYAPEDLEEGGGLDESPCVECPLDPRSGEENEACHNCENREKWDEELEKLKERCTRI